MNDVDRLRGGAEEFLDICLNTDVSLIFAPSQVGRHLFTAMRVEVE